MLEQLKDNSNVILHERFGLTENDRLLLKTLDELSPEDSSQVLLEENDKEFPTVTVLTEILGVSAKEVTAILNHICEVWKIQKLHLPTGNGRLSLVDAQIRAVINQHRLRFDSEINDYRVPRIHFYSSELGTGQLYTNNKAFLGERLFRLAMGYNELMNSYHIQGGVMPEMITMFGKSKNQRALLTGLSKIDGVEVNEDEVAHLTLLIKMMQGKDVSPKQMHHIRENFIKTLDSMEEAAKSVAHELAPLISDIPEYVPIHIYYSYNDDSNLNEIEDQLLSKMREIYKNMDHAEERLPKLRETLLDTCINRGVCDINLKVIEYLRQTIVNSDKLTDKQVPHAVQTALKNRAQLAEFLADVRQDYADKKLGGDVDFISSVNAVAEAYCKETKAQALPLFFKRNADKWQKRRKRALARITFLENTIAEYEQFELAHETEQRSGHAWFTKVVAIKPTESKANEMMKKELYRDLYTTIMLPELKEVTGKNHNITIHTDREITVYVPDPTLLVGKNEYPNNKLYGTLITSVPRVNRQRSNEPMLESTYELQKKHESAIATRLKLGKKRPTTVEEFNKRESCFSDVVWTSHGADGFRLQPKYAVAPTMLSGEYEGDPEIVYYLKTPTRHNMREIGAQMKRGNTGSWVAKRLEKGGPTTGNAMQIWHADGSHEWFFFDDAFYETVANNYHEEFLALETKIASTANKKELKKLENARSALFQKIRVQLNYILLMNDIHLGSYTVPGRPSNIEVTKSTVEAAVQALGLDRISAVQGSEFLHGSLKFRGYDSSYEGLDANPLKLIKYGNIVAKEITEENGEDILKQILALVRENEHARAVFKSRDQKDMFIQFIKPLMLELMDSGSVIFLSAGNHWNESNKQEDEVSAIVAMFDSSYVDSGSMRYQHAGGQSFSIDCVRLPANVNINAIISHKMWHGKTEVGAMMSQASGTKQDALFVIAGDRHHSGMVAEKERFGVLDTGKQSPMPYVSAIGKAPSTRGTVVMGYSPNRDLFYSARFWLDNVAHKLIGWNQRVKTLKQIHAKLKK